MRKGPAPTDAAFTDSASPLRLRVELIAQHRHEPRQPIQPARPPLSDDFSRSFNQTEYVVTRFRRWPSTGSRRGVGSVNHSISSSVLPWAMFARQLSSVTTADRAGDRCETIGWRGQKGPSVVESIIACQQSSRGHWLCLRWDNPLHFTGLSHFSGRSPSSSSPKQRWTDAANRQ